MGLMEVQPPLDGRATPFIQIHEIFCLLPAGRAEDNVVAGHAPVFAQVDGQNVIDALRRQPRKLRVVEQPLRHGAHLHVPQPLVDHIIASCVPQFRIPLAQPPLMAQSGVKVFMSQHEPPLLLGQVSIGIDINLPHLNGNRGNGNVHPLCYKRVFHQPEAGGYAPQKRIAGQEPFLCPLDGAAYPALPRLCPDTSGIVHGGPQSLPQAVRKNLPPVRGASPPAPGRPPPGHVRPSAAHGGEMQIGRVTVLFQPVIQLFLLPGP